jgi:hypothetical protein
MRTADKESGYYQFSTGSLTLPQGGLDARRKHYKAPRGDYIIESLRDNAYAFDLLHYGGLHETISDRRAAGEASWPADRPPASRDTGS